MGIVIRTGERVGNPASPARFEQGQEEQDLWMPFCKGRLEHEKKGQHTCPVSDCQNRTGERGDEGGERRKRLPGTSFNDFN